MTRGFGDSKPYDCLENRMVIGYCRGWGHQSPVTENSACRAGGESGFGGQAFGKLWELRWIGSSCTV